MLVDLFYQLFMMKCERNILIEIKKKKHILESDFQTAALIVITVLLFISPPPSPLPTVLPYQKSKSHLNLTLIRAPSWLFVCACMSACKGGVSGRGESGKHFFA